MIVGLGHRKYVGKDTVGGIILAKLKERNIPVQQRSFAFELKRIAHQLYGWAGAREPHYYDLHVTAKSDLLPALNKTYRQLLIETGQALRSVYEDTWCRPVLEEAYNFSRQQKGVTVLTDVRYENEAYFVKKLGGILIRVDRPSVPKSDDAADVALAEFDRWDMIFENTFDSRGALEIAVEELIVKRKIMDARFPS